MYNLFGQFTGRLSVPRHVPSQSVDICPCCFSLYIDLSLTSYEPSFSGQPLMLHISHLTPHVAVST